MPLAGGELCEESSRKLIVFIKVWFWRTTRLCDERSGKPCRFESDIPGTEENGRAVLEIIYAAYQSAGKGRKVAWPYTPRNRSEVPVNLWLNP